LLLPQVTLAFQWLFVGLQGGRGGF
jgi:hypothetical protein